MRPRTALTAGGWHRGVDPRCILSLRRSDRVLRALRIGPLDEFQVAADIVAPAFIARAALLQLRDERLARQRPGENRRELTGRGQRLARSARQGRAEVEPGGRLSEVRGAIQVALALIDEDRGALAAGVLRSALPGERPVLPLSATACRENRARRRWPTADPQPGRREELDSHAD